MTAEDLFQALGDVDDTYIDCASQREGVRLRRRSLWIRAVSVAACLIVVAASLFAVQQYRTMASVVYPSENGSCGRLATQFDTPTYYSYEELAKASDLVVCADVKKEYHELRDNYILCYAEVCVRDVLKGDVQAGDTILFHDNGKQYRNQEGESIGSMTLCGGPLLEKGNRVVLFIRIEEDAPFVTNSGETLLYECTFGEIGKFFLDNDGKYYSSALYADDFGEYYLASSMLEDYDPKTLQEISMLVK